MVGGTGLCDLLLLGPNHAPAIGEVVVGKRVSELHDVKLVFTSEILDIREGLRLA